MFRVLHEGDEYNPINSLSSAIHSSWLSVVNLLFAEFAIFIDSLLDRLALSSLRCKVLATSIPEAVTEVL